MRLARFGKIGVERPGPTGPDGALRDLSPVLDDMTATALADGALARITDAAPDDLPRAPDNARPGEQDHEMVAARP
jgi:hypothetical protein